MQSNKPKNNHQQSMKKIILFSIAVLYVMGNANAWNVAAEPRLTENAYREVVKEAIAPMTQQQEDAFEYLVVWHKDRTIVTFHLAEKPKITYSGEKAIIQASTVIEYDFQEIKKMSFEKEIPIPTGISEKSIQRERPFKFGGETITFTCGDKDLTSKSFRRMA